MSQRRIKLQDLKIGDLVLYEQRPEDKGHVLGYVTKVCGNGCVVLWNDIGEYFEDYENSFAFSDYIIFPRKTR